MAVIYPVCQTSVYWCKSKDDTVSHFKAAVNLVFDWSIQWFQQANANTLYAHSAIYVEWSCTCHTKGCVHSTFYLPSLRFCGSNCKQSGQTIWLGMEFNTITKAHSSCFFHRVASTCIVLTELFVFCSLCFKMNIKLQIFKVSWIPHTVYITVQVWSSWMPGMESLSQTPARSKRKQRSSTSLCPCSAWSKTPNSSSQSPLRSVHVITYVCGKPIRSQMGSSKPTITDATYELIHKH